MLFEAVRVWLLERKDSLQHFYAHWDGSPTGLETWFRVEFVAAVDPTVARIRTGSAGGRGRSGIKCPDLWLSINDSKEIPVELKAATVWQNGGANINTKYAGQLFATLSLEQSPLPIERKLQLKSLDPQYQCAPICEVHGPKGNRTFYFVMLDLPPVALEDQPIGIPPE